MLRRRMTLATLSLMAMVLIATAAGLIAQGFASGRLTEMIATDRNITTALELSLAVRDVYAHQAHSIIQNDHSHLEHYTESVREAKDLLGALEGLLRADEAETVAADRAALRQLDTDIAILDITFRESVVPGIGGARDALVAPHETALAAIDRITHAVDGLTMSLQSRMQDARMRAEDGGRAASIGLIALAALAILVAALITWRTARALGPPLASLAHGARRFASGDLAHRIPLPDDHAGNELTTLATQMNAMAGDLAKHQARLVEAETLASVGRLAASVAHEVNNPLAAILGFARLVERIPDAQSDAARIVRETERCRDIVKGLLELSRPARLDLQPVDVAAVGELVAEINESFVAAGLGEAKLRLDGAGTVRADLAKLRQVLWNLMKNAHEAGGPVEVAVIGSGTGLRITVTDRGAGLPQGVDPGAIFEPFVSSKSDGMGLGLAVSLAIVQRHGGRLTAEPGASGRGASFVIVLEGGLAVPRGAEPRSAA